MANSISYEYNFTDIHAHDSITRISYILCRPPRRLKLKGSLILLHDFFKTNYQFRYVIDLFAMAGYATFALDLPGKHISAHPRQCGKISIASLSTDLVHFINLDTVQQPLHIAGIGMGAQLASFFTERHPNMVASMIVVEPQRSEKSEDALKYLSSLPIKIPSTVRRNTFNRYLDISSQISSNLASDEVDEYAESFSDSHMLLDMQQAYCSFLNCTSKIDTRPANSTRLKWLPEEQPEDFAIGVLSTFRKAIQPVTMKPEPKSHLPQHFRPSQLVTV